MDSPQHKPRFAPTLLLLACLIGAQWGTVLHAFQHDAGAPQSQVCKTCVAASQLGTACIESSPCADPAPSFPVLHAGATSDLNSFHSLTARQRGPPLSP